MEILLKYVILLYFLILFGLYLNKPSLFQMDEQNKKRKLIYLIALFVVIAILSFYIKIIIEKFF